MAVTGLPFNGRGSSGFGSYKGKASIDCFSTTRTVVDAPTITLSEMVLETRYPMGDQNSKYIIWKAAAMEAREDLVR
ncbi:MAG: hypothetical protein LQ346_002126, partial [Caloplaca aetnensis]